MEKTDEEIKKEYLKKLKIEDLNKSQLLSEIKVIEKFPLFLNDSMKFHGKSIKGYKMFEILSRMQDANTWLKKCNYLFNGVNKSVITALDLIDENELFVPFRVNKKDENTFYFIENSLYRLFSLWDVLAQLYNWYFSLIPETKGIHYNRFFNNNSFNEKIEAKLYEELKYKEVVELVKKQYQEINEYIQEKDELINGVWKGHHCYLKEIRNKFTHRENPHDFTILNNGNESLKLPDAPLFEINRVIKDYVQVYFFICQVFKLYCLEFSKYGIWFEPGIKAFNPLEEILKNKL